MSPKLLSFEWQKCWEIFRQRCPNVPECLLCESNPVRNFILRVHNFILRVQYDDSPDEYGQKEVAS